MLELREGESMKTVQEWLKELDAEKLIEEYQKARPIQYERVESYNSKTVGDIRTSRLLNVWGLIERLRMIPMEKVEIEDNCLLYVHESFCHGNIEPVFEAVNVKDLLLRGYAAENCDYSISEHAMIAGLLVAEAPLTQCYIYELMADVLIHASFFGYEQEGLAELRWLEVKDQRKKVTVLHKELPLDTNQFDMKVKNKDAADEKETREWKRYLDVLKAVNEYNNYSKIKELVSVLDGLSDVLQ